MIDTVSKSDEPLQPLDLKTVPNRQWKYVIFSIEDGSVCGTDSYKAALEFSRSEYHFVVDLSTCQVIDGSLLDGAEGVDQVADIYNIPEQTVYTF